MTDSSSPPAEPRPDSPHADRLHPSPNHGERRGTGRPDSIILHYTGMADAAAALLWLANPLSQVSSHYFVFEDGRIWQMVPENRRAWHAGRSSWQRENDMNSRSIGIEIANPGHDLTKMPPEPGTYPDFPPAQIEAVIRLVADIKARWGIPDSRILAHSDIAPGRKVDPGERFPWAQLAAAGLGLWVTPPPAPADAPAYRAGDEGMPVAALQAMLARFGYNLEITGVFDAYTVDVITAFQRHWRQDKVDGVADGETLATLRALAALS
ncbi:MAG: N-acetylmuramoyl-L-alanine amidase [Beijerinckiaceae bacterium]|nr:N-acetylmuramoyl-L-alanine amidase [Beijerinckiaceae bacterium]MCZ8301162.1 N-acetylmuramoyl-L-alanine amidase [Beijerinckiaceae bacterium]